MRSSPLLLGLVLALSSCGSGEAPAPPPAGTGFVDRRPGSGIEFVNHTGRPDVKDWIHESKGGGALVLDYDGDGRMDLYVIDGNVLRLDPDGRLLTREAEPAAGNRLYRNLGNWRFEDVTEKAGVGDRTWGFGGGVGDFDGDGRPDLYVCNWGPNRLYRNDGDGTFTDVAGPAGVAGGTSWFSTGATFFDADGDGDLDLYVTNYNDMEALILETRGVGKQCRLLDLPVYAGPQGTPPARDQFYRNDGDGTFTDDSDRALVGQQARYSFTAVAADFDRDGDQDLYVTNDSTPNTLWVNDGKGIFEDRGTVCGVDVSAFGGAQAGMGNDSADYDQDGWPDVFVTNFSLDRNTLYRNLTGEIGDLFFEDFTERAGLATADFEKTCWGTKFADLDQDGYLDLFVAAGHVYPEVLEVGHKLGIEYRQRPSLWISTGPPEYRFEEVSARIGGPGMAVPVLGRAACFADLDDDGDVDVYVYCLNDRPLLLENRLPKRGGFLQIALEQPGPNRQAFGAKVTMVAGGGRIRQVQEMRVSASFLGTNDPRLHWGLGAAEKVDELTVEWPGGEKQVFADLPGNHLYRIARGGRPVEVR